MFVLHSLIGIVLGPQLFSFLNPSNPDKINLGWNRALLNSTEPKCRYTSQTIESNPGLDGIVAFERVHPTDMSKYI